MRGKKKKVVKSLVKSINVVTFAPERCPEKCNMYKRKIEETLAQWKERPNRKPLVIKGCRQCGKTSSVLDFANRNYEHVIYMDFHEHKEYKAFFASALDVDTLTLAISAGMRGTRFVEGRTCLVLDEIQECPNSRALPCVSCHKIGRL
jgi:predicted AAA+ superfamily ATPase